MGSLGVGTFRVRSEHGNGMAATNDNRDVIGGVDTHEDVHAAAALSASERLLGTAPFSTTRAGCGQLLTWLTGHGKLISIGVEGTGSYGSGHMRHLRSASVSVGEMNRPNRNSAVNTASPTPWMLRRPIALRCRAPLLAHRRVRMA
jgi:hypothetical protein